MTSNRQTRPLIAGNWKMNLSTEEAAQLVISLAGVLKSKNESGGLVAEKTDVVIAPPTTLLRVVEPLVKNTKIGVAAQNMHYASKGAYTGEVSLDMIKEAGCQWVILGHSERRQYFGESDESVNRKTIVALNGEVNPIICIGETLEEKKSGLTENKVTLQVRAALTCVPKELAKRVTIAYEPIWAIGTGETATPEEAQKVHEVIRGVLAEMYGKEVADAIRILYGGSAKPSNASDLLSQADIDGLLIGGASLKFDSFVDMIKSADALATI